MTIQNSEVAALLAAQDATLVLNEWLKNNPVVENEDVAREAKVMIDRGTLCRADMESERDGKVRPLNTQVSEINETYRGPRGILDSVVLAVRTRLAAFVVAEENKRLAVLEEARLRAAEAERIAREAEEMERKAAENAAAGELDIDVAAVTQAADDAFGEFSQAKREADLAERDSTVKIGGGFRRSFSLRKKEILIVDDIIEALDDLGVTEEIEEAVIKAAKAFRKLNNRLPRGIKITEERTL